MSFNRHAYTHTHTHTHTHPHKPSWNHPLRVTTEESGLIATRQMVPAHPAPSPPQQPRGEDCLLCSGLPASVLGDVSAPAPHGLTSASLTDQCSRLCSKDPVSLQSASSVGDWALSSHPPKETFANPECGGSARLQPEGGETHFLDENRSWNLSVFVGFGGLDQVCRL